MTEIRYDGPDVEADTSGRVQGLLMAGVMTADGLHAGRQAASNHTDHTAQTRQAAADRADRRLWAGIPDADLTDLDDDTLATRWQAAARHLGEHDADTARAGIERELAERDPDTMRDYRSWRYAAGLEPGPAMQHALTERETRLAAAWQPLSTGAPLDEAGLAAGWVAALGSHHPDAAAAAATGEQLMRAHVPELMARYDTARAAETPTPDGQRTPGQVSPLTAAGQATGARTVFGPGTGWADTLHHGHPQPAGTPTTSTAPTARRSPDPHAHWLAATAHQHTARRP